MGLEPWENRGLDPDSIIVKATIFPSQRMVKPKHDYNFSRSVVYSIPDSEINQATILKRKGFFLFSPTRGIPARLRFFFEFGRTHNPVPVSD